MQVRDNPFSTLSKWISDAAGSAAGAVGDAVRSAAAAVEDGVVIASHSSQESQAADGFKAQFGNAARDKDKFHALMKTVYGDKYDVAKAEQFRQQALKGDFSFLPAVKFVSRETLQGGHGAYNADEGVIYLAEDLKSNPDLMKATFIEEAGHHLDTQLNTSDTKGDEGEMFRRLLGGEKLTAAQMNAIRNENDKGVITVNGKQVEVEFWNPFKAIKKAAKKVGDAVSGAVKAVGNAVKKVVTPVVNAVSDAAQAVGKVVKKVVKPIAEAVVDTAKGIGRGIVEVGKGIFNAGKNLVTGVGEGIGGFLKNIVKGHVTDAFRSLLRGADKAIFGSTGALVNGVINGVEEGAKGLTHLLGPLGKPIRDEFIPRVADIFRQGFNTLHELGRDGFRLTYELPLGFAEDMGKALGHAIKGEWGEAAKRFGLGFANVGSRIIGTAVDSIARTLQGLADIGQVATGQAPPSRALTDDEIALLREVYGDSIDYSQVRIKVGGPLNADINGRARVVGNTIYMPSGFGSEPLRNPDGTLTDTGELLIHEAGHIWQSQNGGGDYIHQALYGQEIGDGYDYQKAINEGKSFRELNPEQQAEYLAHELGDILAQPGSAEENLRANLTGAELAFALDALAHVREGSGTPEGLW